MKNEPEKGPTVFYAAYDVYLLGIMGGILIFLFI